MADSAQDLVESCDVVLSLGLPGEDVAFNLSACKVGLKKTWFAEK